MIPPSDGPVKADAASPSVIDVARYAVAVPYTIA